MYLLIFHILFSKYFVNTIYIYISVLKLIVDCGERDNVCLMAIQILKTLKYDTHLNFKAVSYKVLKKQKRSLR